MEVYTLIFHHGGNGTIEQLGVYGTAEGAVDEFINDSSVVYEEEDKNNWIEELEGSRYGALEIPLNYNRYIMFKTTLSN